MNDPPKPTHVSSPLGLPRRDCYRKDFPRYCTNPAAGGPGPGGAATAGGQDWRRAYRSRLQHDANWRTGTLMGPVEVLRSHSG